jgi:hypothetical protein
MKADGITTSYSLTVCTPESVENYEGCVLCSWLVTRASRPYPCPPLPPLAARRPPPATGHANAAHAHAQGQC